mmetsp:Transcript_46868/g.101779  ORF Transcript_46868/g.101779 Transcript_46868/m.101779 type:complete len:283 (+) Transcript_46868:530-1378(+)
MSGSGLRRFLHKGVDLSHAILGLLQDGLSDALICHGLLEVSILSFTELGSSLHLLLHLGDCGALLLDCLGQHLHSLRVISDACLQVRLLVGELILGKVVLLSFIDAPVAVFHLIFLLFGKVGDHLIDRSLDFGEGVKLHGRCKCDELRLPCMPQNSCSALPGLRRGLFHGAQLQKAAGLEGTKGLIGIEECNGVCHRKQLLLPALHPGLVLCLRLRASLLQVGQEGLVNLELVHGVIHLLIGLRILLAEVCVILLELLQLRLASCQLCLLGCLDSGEVLLGR